MELIVKVEFYHCAEFTLSKGQSTADLKAKVSEEKKRQLLASFPEWFDAAPDVEFMDETPEQKLPKLGNLRKK